MLNPWVSLAVYETEMLISFVFFSAVFPRRVSGRKCLLVGFLLFAAGSAVNLIFVNNGVLNTLVTVLLNSLFARFCFQQSACQGIFYSIILGTVNAALETIVIGLFSAFTGSIMQEYNRNLPLLIVEGSTCKGLYFLISLLFARMVRPGVQTIRLNRNLFFFPVAAVVCQTISWYILVQPDTPGKTHALLAVSSVLLMFATMLLFITYQDQIRKDGEAIQVKNALERLQTEASYYQILEQQNHQLMMCVHDTKKHLAAIKSLEDDPQINSYVEKLSQQLADYSHNCHSGNKLLDVMIHKFSIDCETKGIHFDYEIKLCNLKVVEDIDLVAILGNLMDNAITAAEQSLDKTVSLATAIRNTYNVIVISNSCDIPPKVSGKQLISSKEDQTVHGFGLKSVARTLKKYSGDFEWTYDLSSRTFTVTVMLGGRNK